MAKPVRIASQDANGTAVMTPITKPKPGAGTRVEWIDATKGIGIMLVVLAHCWRGLIDSSIMQWNDGLRLLDYGIYSFHMPLFFLLSGLTGGGALYRGGSVGLHRLAAWISGLPLVDHAAARSGWSKYNWSGVRPPSAECGLTAL